MIHFKNDNGGNHFSVCKQMRSGLFKNNVTYLLFAYKSYIYIYILQKA